MSALSRGGERRGEGSGPGAAPSSGMAVRPALRRGFQPAEHFADCASRGRESRTNRDKSRNGLSSPEVLARTRIADRVSLPTNGSKGDFRPHGSNRAVTRATGELTCLERLPGVSNECADTAQSDRGVEDRVWANGYDHCRPEARRRGQPAHRLKVRRCAEKTGDRPSSIQVWRATMPQVGRGEESWL